jgi:hypothetical protein
MGFRRRVVRKSVRRATPRPVRHAMHPARTVRNAVTPRPVKQVSRAAYTARPPIGAAEKADRGSALSATATAQAQVRVRCRWRLHRAHPVHREPVADTRCARPRHRDSDYRLAPRSAGHAPTPDTSSRWSNCTAVASDASSTSASTASCLAASGSASPRSGAAES